MPSKEPSNTYIAPAPAFVAGVPIYNDDNHASAQGSFALRDNIAPTRDRARLVLEKGPDHRIASVALRA